MVNRSGVDAESSDEDALLSRRSGLLRMALGQVQPKRKPGNASGTAKRRRTAPGRNKPRASTADVQVDEEIDES